MFKYPLRTDKSIYSQRLTEKLLGLRIYNTSLLFDEQNIFSSIYIDNNSNKIQTIGTYYFSTFF